jgi:hypothetical protein
LVLVSVFVVEAERVPDTDGVRVDDRVRVVVRVGVCVRVFVAVAVTVLVVDGVPVPVGVAVSLAVGVPVGDAVTDGVLVSELEPVSLAVGVGVPVGEADAVCDQEADSVAVGVCVGVSDAVLVLVAVTDGVNDGVGVMDGVNDGVGETEGVGDGVAAGWHSALDACRRMTRPSVVTRTQSSVAGPHPKALPFRLRRGAMRPRSTARAALSPVVNVQLAIVRMMPVGLTWRRDWLLLKISSSPFGFIAAALGPNRPASRAFPPSPKFPAVPVPATAVTMRVVAVMCQMRWPD